MCVLVVKPDKDGKPHRAKSRIVVLGNFEDHYYAKSQRYAPVLKYSSLRLLTSQAVGDRQVLQQGDYKNAFCQAYLPQDERMVVRPPVGDPAYAKDEYWLLNKTLYGLRRSPHHWYNLFISILCKIHLAPFPHDPCLFTSIVGNPDGASKIITSPPSPEKLLTSSVNTSKDTTTPVAGRAPIRVGVYVDDFIFYSTNPGEEELFKKTLAEHINVTSWKTLTIF